MQTRPLCDETVDIEEQNFLKATHSMAVEIPEPLPAEEIMIMMTNPLNRCHDNQVTRGFWSCICLVLKNFPFWKWPNIA